MSTALTDFSAQAAEAYVGTILRALEAGFRSKGVNTSIDEMVKMINMPSVSVPKPTAAAPRGARAQTGGEQCDYLFVRGKSAGTRCPKKAVVGSTRCTGCATKGQAKPGGKAKAAKPPVIPGMLPQAQSKVAEDESELACEEWGPDKDYSLDLKDRFLLKAVGPDETVTVFGVDRNNTMQRLTEDEYKSAVLRKLPVDQSAMPIRAGSVTGPVTGSVTGPVTGPPGGMPAAMPLMQPQQLGGPIMPLQQAPANGLGGGLMPTAAPQHTGAPSTLVPLNGMGFGLGFGLGGMMTPGAKAGNS